MADFFGGLQPKPLSGPFPDANVSTPKPPSISVLTIPPAPFDPITGTPSLADPFERVNTFVRAAGVDPNDFTAQGPGEQGSHVSGTVQNIATAYPTSQTVNGTLHPSPADDWFEKWIVTPGRLDLGNVLSTQVRTLEIVNTDRRVARTWQAFVNNTTGGISITNLPALPLVIASLDSFINNVQIDTIGPPTIAGTLDFDVDLNPPDIIEIPVTGQRILIFRWRPQQPIRETLEFKTDVIAHNDGTEQRINVREVPRQRIRFTVRTANNRSRDNINLLVFDWHHRVWGVPIWWEQKPLDAAIAVDDTTIQVDTANADFRVGGLVTVYNTDFLTETLEIATVNANDLVVTVPISQAFPVFETVVIPTRTAYLRPQLTSSRYPIGPTDFPFDFETLDNRDLSDASAFDTYQGVGETSPKVLIDRLNFIRGATVREGFRRKVTRLDHETGPFVQFSPWSKSKPSIDYTFEAKSFAEVWEFRQLVHSLRGSQVSFYLETGRDDFKVVADIADTATDIDIENIGFTDFVGVVVPRADLQIRRTDGTLSRHQVTGSVVVNDDVERVSVTPGITPALPAANIERVEFLTLGRIERDEVRFDHARPGEARVEFRFVGLPG